VWQSPGDSDLTDLALDAGGRHVVGVAARGGARLWEVGRAGAVLSVPAVRHAEFSADGRYLLTHDVNTAQVWDVRSRLTIAAVACRCAIRDVRLSPDRRLLAVVADDGTLRLRPVAAGGVARDLEYPDPEGALAFSADGALLAVERIERELSEADNPGRPRVVGVARVEVVVWNPRTGQRLATIRLDGPAGSLLFSADGRFVAAGGRVWEAATGREVARVDGTIVAFSPDQALLVTAGEPTRVWRWRPDDLMATACERLPRNLTAAEWRDFLGAEPYRKTCARLP
jgi:WD40 repeat protein